MTQDKHPFSEYEEDESPREIGCGEGEEERGSDGEVEEGTGNSFVVPGEVGDEGSSEI